MEWHLRSCNTYANCDRGDWTDMMPRHDVVLSPFYIDIYEVTNAQYRECIAAGKCSKPQQDRINRYLDSDYATSSAFNNYPVVAIAWSDAKNYCEWVGNKTLPTEAQWEFVAKGENDQFYPWVLRPSGTNARAVFDGSAPLANFCDKECPMENWKESKLDDGYVGPAPVGSYPPGPYGIYDMAGNVTEWILDVYSDDFYSKSSRNDPVFLDSGPWRVTRGGGWNNGFYGISSVVRSAQVPSDSKAFIGFRCVNEAP
jgi:formylglycine-generating enzyme required for sulfatase activity